MTTAPSPDSFIGRNAVDPQGNKIGPIGQVYVNDQTGQPDWITINTGLFGMKENFAPLAGSRLSGDDLVLPFDKTVVRNSPEIADASHLDPDEQQSLNAYYQHYAGSVAVPGADRGTTDNARQETGYQQGAGRSPDPPRVGTEPVDDDRAAGLANTRPPTSNPFRCRYPGKARPADRPRPGPCHPVTVRNNSPGWTDWSKTSPQNANG